MIREGKDIPSRSPLTISQQAEFIDYITSRCTMRDGTIARETLSLLTEDEVNTLIDIAGRLHRMAPHEDQIRRIVSRR